MPRQIFKNRVIAAAGPLPGQFTVDNLKQWTKLRRGRFQESFDEEVTHLLCTQEQFDTRVPIVKNALKHRKDVHILHYDWFEFSTVENKRLPERDYSMRAILAQKNAERREKARIERGKKEGERGVNTNLFHVYHDEEYFPYQIDIRRDDDEAGDFGQRHILTLWESNARPHLYWFTAKFLRKKGDSQPNFYRPSSCSGVMNTEIGHFKHFFRAKTGLEWQDRVMKQGTQPATSFHYTPPTGGKPVGGDLRFSYDYCVKINEELQEEMQIDAGTVPVSLNPGAGSGTLEDHVEFKEAPDEAENACSLSQDNIDNVQPCSSEEAFSHGAAATTLNASNVEIEAS